MTDKRAYRFGVCS